MLKIPFLVLAFLFSVSIHASNETLKYAEYVHLSNAQKDAYVIKIMELITELETRYKREVKTSGFNQERFERYTSLMKQITSLLMGEAHAEENKALASWKKKSEDFISIMQSPSNGPSDKCVYAGWPSRVQGGLCVHPKYVGANAPEVLSYQDSKDCQGREVITCNPAIFGYKNESEQSVFCVKAGRKESDNSSLFCMAESLSVESRSGVDSKETRLKFLRENLGKHKSIFDGVQQFVYKTCICETTPSTINQRYHNYMRPHRTCYGLMQMITETILCKADGDIGVETGLFKQLVDFSAQNLNRELAPKEIDSLYQGFLGNIQTTLEYQNLCGGKGAPASPKEKGYECQATCEAPKASKSEKDPKEGKDAKPREASAPGAFTCTFVIVDKETGKEVTPSEAIKELPTSKEATSLDITAILDGKSQKLACALNFPEAPEEEKEKPSIKVSLGKKSATTQGVTAEVTGEQSPYKIVWYRKNFPGAEKAPKEKEKAKPTGIATDSEEEEEAKPEEKPEPEPEKGVSDIADSEDKDKIEEPLKDKTYDTCAKLVAEGKEDIAGNCVAIPKLQPKPVIPAAPVNQPLPPSGRGSSSTSAVGIK